MLIIEVKLNKTTNGCMFLISHEVDGEQIAIIKQRIEYTDLSNDLKFWAIRNLYQ